MVCGLPQAFGLRNDKGVNGSEFFFFSVFVFIVSGLWIAFLLAMTKKKNRHCENRRFVAILFILGSSLRGFEKAVAISFILGLSLREPKVRGNLGMEHYGIQPTIVIARVRRTRGNLGMTTTILITLLHQALLLFAFTTLLTA